MSVNITLTDNQAVMLDMFLRMKLNSIKEEVESYKELAASDIGDAEHRRIWASNANWYARMGEVAVQISELLAP